MMPERLRSSFQSDVIPDDANLVIFTHFNYSTAISGLSICLAAKDPSCNILCTEDIAFTLRQTAIANPSKITICTPGLTNLIGMIRIVMMSPQSKDEYDSHTKTGLVF